jgi:hypothetical protein
LENVKHDKRKKERKKGEGQVIFDEFLRLSFVLHDLTNGEMTRGTNFVVM